MLIDIVKKYMNIIIVIVYVTILYSYEFKENIPLLLVITGLFIYLLYNNKSKEEVKIVENFDEQTTTQTTRVSDTELQAIREALSDVSNRINNYDQNRQEDIVDRLNRISNMFANFGRNTNINNLPSIGEVNVPEIGNISIPNTGNFNFNLENLRIPNIHIPENVMDEYRKNEIPRLKRRIKALEDKLKELDEEENVNVIREKIMDLEVETKKWDSEEFDKENEKSGDNIAKRKVRSYASSKSTTPMGMYDGLCLERLKKENINKLADEKDVNTFLGTSIPLKVKVADNSDLDGPSVDGNEKSPKRLNMFETNKTSIACCEDSPYLSSNGCVCLTNDQNDYLINRGGNHEDKSSS